MGLHSLSGEALEYHCHNPGCQYHNCANWAPWLQCAHHDIQKYERQGDTFIVQRVGEKPAGSPRMIPLDHPDIKWTNTDLVALPVCGCGTQMFLKVSFTPQELAASNIQTPIRDPLDAERILDVQTHPMVSLHQQLAEALTAKGNAYVPPTLDLPASSPDAAQEAETA